MKRLKCFSSFAPMVLGMFLLVSLSGFKVLDPASKNSLLRELADLLDANNIDVMLDWRSNASTEGRPVLAPLAAYVLPSASEVTKFEGGWVSQFDAWVNAFDQGDLQILLAAPKESSGINFKEKWDQASAEKRIFLSFASEDQHLAESVRGVLEQKGFTVFTYLSGNEMELSASKIAYYMATSGNRLVLDTEHSRLKSGVLAESLAEARYKFAYNEELAGKISEIRKTVESTDFDSILEDMRSSGRWTAMTPAEQEAALQQYEIQRKSVLSELSREQSSGRIQIEILLKVLAICPYYKIPMVICPICSRALLK